MSSIFASEVADPGASPWRGTRENAPSSGAVQASFRRPRPSGKFLFVGDEKFWVRGVTYGTFCPGDQGVPYPAHDVVEKDFTQIAASGMNSIRTYTVPPRWLLDAAHGHGLRVMVGLPWEEHITFLDDKERTQNIIERVRCGVRACADHPAVLCYAVGNEIPASIARWYGPRRIEGYLERLYRAAKREDPEALVTYISYPSTEYLQLPFLDLVCFNVFLESQQPLEAYLARLHNIAGDRPLILTELGLDSRRNGEDVQARTLDWQVRTTFASGCAGAFVFAWTDEWYRGGYDIAYWDFGLTTRDRHPKPALEAVRNALAQVPFPPDVRWPLVSVVVCSHNGSRTIRECCEGLRHLEYSNFEVIVVVDGSTDGTAAIAQEFGFKVIQTENRGLSSARNTGLHAATGEIVAYLDDDARPDPHWLTYLAATFLHTDFAGVGGPNIPPPEDPPVAQCVANAPGGPVHVLLTDCEAEHIPGCNMAFRRDRLLAIGGFDPHFRAAGDDVDACWRLRDRGWKLGFSPAAMVWHRRRSTVRAYWKQQVTYGKAEALLERKWPEKYNAVGHLAWTGRIYGNGIAHLLAFRPARIYHGTWGVAPFQSRYEPASSFLSWLPMMPEWFLIKIALAALAALGLLWRPLLLALPLLVTAILASIIQAGLSALQASFREAPRSWPGRIRLRLLTGLLHLLQPIARLSGRIRYGLTRWRRRGLSGLRLPWPRTDTIWSTRWRAPEEWLESFQADLRARRAVVVHGGNCDRWDLEVRDGALGAVRLLMAIEEHGAGRQLVRFRSWPRVSFGGLVVTLLPVLLSVGAGMDRAWLACGVLGGMALWLALRMWWDCAAATAAVQRGFQAEAAVEASRQTVPRFSQIGAGR